MVTFESIKEKRIVLAVPELRSITFSKNISSQGHRQPDKPEILDS